MVFQPRLSRFRAWGRHVCRQYQKNGVFFQQSTFVIQHQHASLFSDGPAAPRTRQISSDNSVNNKFRLPKLTAPYQHEIGGNLNSTGRYFNLAATQRILEMALQRVVFEPPTLHLMAASIFATLGVGLVEATLLCQAWPFTNADAAAFCLRYSGEQLFPSVVWVTQDAHLIAKAMGLDPAIVLHDLSGTSPASANILLQTQFLATSRYFFAGFMMIAQLFRAGHVSMNSIDDYKERIRLGREPPLPLPKGTDGGLVIRLCGQDSHVSEVSLKRMGRRIFPVVEDPERVQHWLWKNNSKQQQPVPIYWCVSPGQYHSSYSWDDFPSNEECLWEGVNKSDKILILEADATNGNDPLSIGEASLDLTLEDAGQGFRRILERFRENQTSAFRTLRVYLGNSQETKHTGGGHQYTIRQRIDFAKEFDVMIDSRAPVLHKILEWCQATRQSARRRKSSQTTNTEQKLLFQTSSRAYFLNLRALLRKYGFEIYDPMDVRYILQEEAPPDDYTTLRRSLLDMLSEDEIQLLGENDKPQKSENDYSDTRTNDVLANKFLGLPRLIHFETTAETVCAVESMILGGEIEARNTAVIIDREEGVTSLENTLRQSSGFVEQREHHWARSASWMDETAVDELVETGATTNDENEKDGSGLEIICSSSIHDDVLRQVRLWARMGFSPEEIQYEVDALYEPVLHQSRECQMQVDAMEESKKETSTRQEAKVSD